MARIRSRSEPGPQVIRNGWNIISINMVSILALAVVAVGLGRPGGVVRPESVLRLWRGIESPAAQPAVDELPQKVGGLSLLHRFRIHQSTFRSLGAVLIARMAVHNAGDDAV